MMFERFLVFLACLTALVYGSYLDPPFFTFLGQFYTNPGTLNNFIRNFNPNNTVTPWWNPEGVNYFRIRASNVTAAFTPQGKWLSSANSSVDCLLGATITSSGSDSAKLVDIDPDDQFISQIFGLVISITLPDGKSKIQGKWYPAGLRGQWIAAQCPLPDFHPKFGNDTRQRAGDWQSILTNVKWTGDFDCSPVLQQLRKASPSTLSIKINTDDFNNDIDDEFFCYGRIRGVVGPYTTGDPVEYLPDRMLWPSASGVPSKIPPSEIPTSCVPPTDLPFNIAPLHVLKSSTGTTLLFDLGNSVPLLTPHGDSLFPMLTPSVKKADGTYVPLSGCQVQTVSEVYLNRAGITSCVITAEQAKLVAVNPVVLEDSKGNFVLAEKSNGILIFAEPRNNRLEFGAVANVTLYARKFGNPLPGLKVDFALVPSPMKPRADRINNTPLEGLKYPLSVISGSDGTFQFSVIGGNVSAGVGLPTPRLPLDSQIYFLSSDPKQDFQLPLVDFLVFNSRPKQSNVTWASVAPVLNLYAMLFPGMNDILDLTNEDAVKNSAASILYTINLDHNDPGYMPVTRDLSASGFQILNQFLQSVHPAPYQDKDETTKAAFSRYQVNEEGQKDLRRFCPFLAKQSAKKKFL